MDRIVGREERMAHEEARFSRSNFDKPHQRNLRMPVLAMQRRIRARHAAPHQQAGRIAWRSHTPEMRRENRARHSWPHRFVANGLPALIRVPQQRSAAIPARNATPKAEALHERPLFRDDPNATQETQDITNPTTGQVRQSEIDRQSQDAGRSGFAITPFGLAACGFISGCANSGKRAGRPSSAAIE